MFSSIVSPRGNIFVVMKSCKDEYIIMTLYVFYFSVASYIQQSKNNLNAIDVFTRLFACLLFFESGKVVVVDS